MDTQGIIKNIEQVQETKHCQYRKV